MQDVNDILSRAEQEIQQASGLTALDAVRVRYLGKKGLLTELLKSLSQLSAEERPKVGQTVNLAKQKIQTLLNERRKSFQRQQIEEKLISECIDVTLPSRGQNLGSLHPVRRVWDRIVDIFSRIGFTIEEGPEVEDRYHNFEALNMPLSHPACAEHDTFYFPDGKLLRTHTSPVQIRYMKEHNPPFRMIAPGRVYRRDFDASHTPMFHQVEGLVVDENICFGDLKTILSEFIREFFEEDLKTRFRPSYFPFTEPSAEVDMQCMGCHGKGCNVCKGTGWLEILGCGMVHSNVLEAGKIDPEKYLGYAFGLGLDRLAMKRYKISDLRILFENDIRFLEEF